MSYSIKIVGPAGFGIKVTGQILAKYFLRLGAHVFTYSEYPSLIRGGHNTYQIEVNDEPVSSASEKTDILIVLNEEALPKELNNLKNGAVIICDEKITQDPRFREDDKENYKFIKAPLVKLANESGGELMKNTVALGVLLSLLENVIPSEARNLDFVNKIIEEVFGGKKDIVEQNKTALQEGYEWGKINKIKRSFGFAHFVRSAQDKLMVTGNQACALGALAAGCQLYSAYPMTPATEILHYLIAKEKETGIIVHQAEDEIAAIHTALGASFAGARAAVGTSGGGFALMNETLSLSAMTETPVVIFEVTRPGPATGLPTWTEQGDLLYVINAGHGEFGRLVLAPGNPEECFNLTQQAFNLADKYQLPAFVLSDKFLGESSYTISGKIFDKVEKINRGEIIKTLKQESIKTSLFNRYQLSKNGVSGRSIPGLAGGEHLANSDEHDEFGLCNEQADNRQAQVAKRNIKMDLLKKEIPLPKIYGPKNAEITLVCWGSMLGPCLDAMSFCHSRESGNPEKEIKNPGSRVKHGMTNNINVMHFSYVWPMPLGLDKFLNKFERLVLVENNSYGQMGKLICEETGIEIKDQILKYNGRPFWKEEIVARIKGIKD